MAKEKNYPGPGPKMGPREDGSKTNDSWSGETGSDVIPDIPDAADSRMAQMRHGDESAEREGTTEKPDTADFFEPLNAGRGEDARRAEGE